MRISDWSSDVCSSDLSCDSCQKIRANNQREAGLLQSIPVESVPFRSVSMDFITNLPKTKTGNESIFVVVDRFSKMAEFIPMHGDLNAKEVAKLFIDNVFKHQIGRASCRERVCQYV